MVLLISLIQPKIRLLKKTREPLLSVPSHPPLSCASNVLFSPLPFKWADRELKLQAKILSISNKSYWVCRNRWRSQAKLSHACFWTWDTISSFWTWDTSSCLFYMPMENRQTAILHFYWSPSICHCTTLHTVTNNKLTKLCSGQISSWRPMMSKHYTLRIFEVLSLNKLTVPRNNKEVQELMNETDWQA